MTEEQRKKKQNNIILIGMSGAGKTTVGKLLSQTLGMPFTDTDAVIVEKTGKSLPQTISEIGNDGFLSLEEEIVSSLRFSGFVVATGGSVIYSEKEMRALGGQGWLVHLDLPYPELYARLSDIAARGIVVKPGLTLEDVYNERLPLYRRYADLSFSCSGKSASACAAGIANAYRETFSKG